MAVVVTAAAPTFHFRHSPAAADWEVAAAEAVAVDTRSLRKVTEAVVVVEAAAVIFTTVSVSLDWEAAEKPPL